MPRASGKGPSPYARRAMSDESRKVASRLGITVIGASPQGPWVVWGVSTDGQVAVELRGRDIDALVAQANKELTNAD